MLYFYIGLAVFILVGTSIAGSASANFWDAVKKRGEMPCSIDMTAADFAYKVLRDKRLPVKVTQTPGKLTDFYSSKNKIIAISEELYNSDSVVALAITAHEIGHAISDYQDKAAYVAHQYLAHVCYYMNYVFYILLAGLIATLIAPISSFWVLLFVFSIAAVILLWFILRLITVQNEKLASKIGIEILKEYGATKEEIRSSKKILKAALITYVGEIFMPFVRIWRFFLKLLDKTIGRLFR